ncbi:MAG: ABC transporter permease [Anaerolineae bacterium]|nr:ABC transporter permease [Anaerolineae bacterium]
MNWFKSQDGRGFLLALPAIFWLGVFFILPLFTIVVISFMSRGAGGVAELPYTLAHYDRTFGVFSVILIRSIRIASITTIVCLFIGYPLAFFISTRKNRNFQNLCLFFIILPFWTNFLVRTYAWRILLGDAGTINAILLSWGWIEEPLRLLNTEFAVLVGLIYGFFPFMVLPIYASIERFDFKFVDAAHDLGANDWTTFWRKGFHQHGASIKHNIK